MERYTALGVEVVPGRARLTSPWTVEVQTDTGPRTLTTRAIVIAAGARPFVPPIPGLEEAGYLTSDTVWNLRELPARLVVLGGGPVGSELAQAFARLGSQVTQVEMAPRLLMREDPEVSARVQQQFEREGVRVLTAHTAARVDSTGGATILVAVHDGVEVSVPCDAILVAVGRVANTTGYGLEELGIGTTPAGVIADRRLPADDLSEHPCVRRRRRVRSSSRTRPRTRPGTPRSTRSSAPSGATRPTTA